VAQWSSLPAQLYSAQLMVSLTRAGKRAFEKYVMYLRELIESADG
jgi:hypothetical protein